MNNKILNQGHPYIITSVAMSSSMLGASFAVADIKKQEFLNDIGAYQILPWDGNGGGSGNSKPKPAGTHAITTTSSLTTQFTITWAVTCNGTTDRMNCTAYVFQSAGQILTPTTMQGVCVGGQFTGTFTAPAGSCVTGTTYNVNFACINQSTQTFTSWAGGITSTIVCT